MANTLKKAFTNENWSKVADNYESVTESFLTRWADDALQLAHQRMLDAVQQRLSASVTADPASPQPPSAPTFVDVGCGTGALCLAFAEKYLSPSPASTSAAATSATAKASIMQDTRIIATDLADGMLARVDEKLDARPRYQRFRSHVTTVQMDGQLLDKLADGSVDIVGSNFGLSIFPDRAQAWRSAARVLRDGGVLFATVWDAQSANLRWVDGCAALAHEAQTAALAQAASGDTATEPSLPTLATPSTKVGHNTILNELRAAGFRDIEMFRTQHSVVVETPSVFVHSLLDNPGFSGFIEHAGRERLETFLFESIAKEGGFGIAAAVDGEHGEPRSVDALKASMRPCTIEFVAHALVATK